MSNSNEKKPKTASQLYNVPQFVHVDSIRREEFLSQIGNFASEHRKIFQSLCEHWQPGINYARFVNQNSSIRFAEKDLLNLLSRLKSSKCGLLKHKCIEGDLKKNTIILTDIGDKFFYYHLVEDEIEISMLTSVHPMLTMSTMLDQGIVIPDSFIETLTPRDFTRSFFKQCENEGRIFKIPTSGDDYFIATSGTLAPLISMCIRRIKEGMKNPTLIASVAKLQSIAILDLKKDLTSNDPNFWRKLTVTIIDAKDEILHKSRTLNKDFFSACELVRFFSENEMKAVDKKRADEKEMLDAMKVVAIDISNDHSFFVDQSELNRKLEKSVNRWPDFKDKFYNTFVKSQKKTQLPQIVYIGSKYIHRDNIHTYFITRIAEYSADLRMEYQNLMELMLRTNNKSNISIFFSNENFRNNIREKISNKDPLMIALLDRPAIVSEAVIHIAKKKMKIREISKIRIMLERYFEPGRLKFRSLEVLFTLDVLEIFQYAFLKIPLWKQLFVRVLGRYDSYRKTFTGMSSATETKTPVYQVSSTPQSREPDFSSMSRDERKREYRNRQRDNRSQVKKHSTSHMDPSVKKRRYSQKEQNEAWSDFGDSFNRKKKIEKTVEITDLEN